MVSEELNDTEAKRAKLRQALENAAGCWKDEDHPELLEKGTDAWVRELREGKRI